MGVIARRDGGKMAASESERHRKFNESVPIQLQSLIALHCSVKLLVLFPLSDYRRAFSSQSPLVIYICCSVIFV